MLGCSGREPNMGSALPGSAQWPADPQGIVQRVLRVLAVVVVYLLTRPVIGWLADIIPLPDALVTGLVWHTVGTLLILGGGIALARWIPRQRRPAQ